MKNKLKFNTTHYNNSSFKILNVKAAICVVRKSCNEISKGDNANTTMLVLWFTNPARKKLQGICNVVSCLFIPQKLSSEIIRALFFLLRNEPLYNII